jgi:nucleoside-diphosphate-sugar epimerase
MISKIQEISNIPKLKKNYQLNVPQSVKGRFSNNDMAIKVLNWKYKISLKTGLEKTYNWI